MTTTMMFRFSYVSALILFLLGILNIVFAWKTHSYLYTADIKRQTIVSYQEHAVFTMMALGRSSHISVQNEQLEGEKKKSTRSYLLIREYGRNMSDACRSSIFFSSSVSALIATTLLIVCLCQFIVDSLEGAIQTLHISSSFTAAIILPSVSAIIEFVTCISCALKNKIELSEWKKDNRVIVRFCR
jgi:Ca2+/H+ antiporter